MFESPSMLERNVTTRHEMDAVVQRWEWMLVNSSFSRLWESVCACVCVSSLQPWSVSGVNTKKNVDADSFSVSNINSVCFFKKCGWSFLQAKPRPPRGSVDFNLQRNGDTNGEEQRSRRCHRWLKRERKNTGNAPATPPSKHALIHPPPPLGM